MAPVRRAPYTNGFSPGFHLGAFQGDQALFYFVHSDVFTVNRIDGGDHDLRREPVLNCEVMPLGRRRLMARWQLCEIFVERYLRFNMHLALIVEADQILDRSGDVVECAFEIGFVNGDEQARNLLRGERVPPFGAFVANINNPLHVSLLARARDQFRILPQSAPDEVNIR